MPNDKREPIVTGDGSDSIYSPRFNEPYHSRHGALAESKHVFIQSGLSHFCEQSSQAIRVFEMGFGTGLNALLSYEFAQLTERMIHYQTVEAYPLEKQEWEKLNYPRLLSVNELSDTVKFPLSESDLSAPFFKMHKAASAQKIIFPNFHFTKHLLKVEALAIAPGSIDVIFFDAFAPEKQSELWTIELFEKCFQCLAEGGILTTYCAKGSARRAMIAAGFTVEKIPGPPGKREMLRARRL